MLLRCIKRIAQILCILRVVRIASLQTLIIVIVTFKLDRKRVLYQETIS